MAYNTALPQATATDDRASDMRAFWKRALVFILIGLALYLVLLVIAEMRVRTTGERNPFYQIVTAAPEDADVVILGASHAMPLGFEGITPLLEENASRNVTVLAMEGGGVAQRIPGDLGVVVGVGVDDAGRHDQALGIDHPVRGLVPDPADGDHPAVGDGDVGMSPRHAGAVDDEPSTDDEVVHGCS